MKIHGTLVTSIPRITHSLTASVLLVSALAVTGCSSPKPKSGSINTDSSVISGNGTIDYMDLEGGVYVIRGDNNITYDPVNLPADMKQDDVPVTYRVKLIPDRMSTHMVGPIVEVVEIKRR
jgi:hypothetical protein